MREIGTWDDGENGGKAFDVESPSVGEGCIPALRRQRLRRSRGDEVLPTTKRLVGTAQPALKKLARIRLSAELPWSGAGRSAQRGSTLGQSQNTV